MILLKEPTKDPKGFRKSTSAWNPVILMQVLTETLGVSTSIQAFLGDSQ